MAASNPTSLSVGLLIYDLLSHDDAVAAKSSKIFPVIAEDGASLPYICYRRGNMENVAVKGSAGADSAAVDVLCYAATYAEAIDLAEAVRNAMDGVQYACATDGGTLIARSIRLTDAEEGWADDAYVESLSFTVKIN